MRVDKWVASAGFRLFPAAGSGIDRFCDLHLVKDHRCGEGAGPHVHVVRRRNPNDARAKTSRSASLADGIVTGGTVLLRRAGSRAGLERNRPPSTAINGQLTG
jgi:hypothetical protein